MSNVEAILETFDRYDSLAAIESICREPDPLESAKTFSEVMRHLYWKRKNLTASLLVGEAGANYGCLTAVRFDGSDPALASELRGVAKGMTYNIASFTWPGWDEPGILITATDLAIGRDAAKANLRLAVQLNKGDLPISRAHWMLAAHLICVPDFSVASEHFELAGKFAIAAGAKADELLARGFLKVVEMLSNPNDSGPAAELKSVCNNLALLEHGPEFVTQIQTAIRVFSPAKEQGR